MHPGNGGAPIADDISDLIHYSVIHSNYVTTLKVSTMTEAATKKRITNYLASFLKVHSNLEPIVAALTEQGATCYLVGGCVRDCVLSLPIKDVDIEVHGLAVDQLDDVLKQFGTTMHVGKQFGVLRIAQYDIDWSLPRKDSSGRKPEVIVDPHMTIQEALRRRDLTMNAMAIDLGLLFSHGTERLEIIDPFGGLQALEDSVLQVVDREFFVEDPLRFFRVMQFVARFEMQPDKELNDLCARMSFVDHVRGVAIARERIFEELQKMLLMSRRPSRSFRWLREIGRLEEVFPEIHSLIDVPQRLDYHPEGDVFEHTMQALDASAELDELIGNPENVGTRLAEKSCEKQKVILMLAALLHDVGKPETTEVVSETVIHSWDHEKAGVPIAQTFLKRITDDTFMITVVKKLIRYHMYPVHCKKNKSGAVGFKKLAASLHPHVSCWHLSMLQQCDLRGRSSSGDSPLPWPMQQEDEFLLRGNQEFIDGEREAGVLHTREEPLLTGKDFLDVLEPGPELGAAVDHAYQLQIEKSITDRLQLKQRVLDGIPR